MTSAPTNTPEAVERQFQREDRYIVIKRKHLTATQEMSIRAYMERLNIRTVECVVVESDWPEYETVWSMIEARVAGAALSAPPAASGEAMSQYGYNEIFNAIVAAVHLPYNGAISISVEAFRHALQPKPDEVTIGWDHRYRPLKEGEIILPTDEVRRDDGTWVTGVCVGSPAPDPNYTSHRVYRRLKPSPDRVTGEALAAAINPALFCDDPHLRHMAASPLSVDDAQRGAVAYAAEIASRLYGCPSGDCATSATPDARLREENEALRAYAERARDALTGLLSCVVDDGGFPRFSAQHGRKFDAAVIAARGVARAALGGETGK